MSDVPAWIADLNLKKLGITGKIAAGKSTLLREAKTYLETKGIRPIIEEEVNNEVLLNAFIKNPKVHASKFQIERACACHHRQEIVMVKREAFGNNHVALVERPLFENRVFAIANQRSGNIPETDIQEFYDPLLEVKNNYPCDLLIYLHITDDRSVQNQAVRGRAGEENYRTEYLSVLGDCYFEFVVEHASKNKMLVVDWSKFGKVEDVLELAADVLSGRKKLPTVTHIECSSDDDLSSSAGITKISPPDGEEAVVCSQPSTRKKKYHDRVIKALSQFHKVEIFI